MSKYMEKEMKQKMPIKTLDELIDYLEGQYNSLTCGDMSDSEGRCFEVAKYIKFLKHLKKLYGRCTGCNRVIAPDEEYVVADEETYCMKCYNEGLM